MKFFFHSHRPHTWFWILSFVLMGSILAAILLGRYPRPGFTSLDSIRTDPIAQNLILNLRLPRILTAVILGASLAAAGTVFQTVFSNPLVEPGFLGVSQGAAFGAAFSIIFLQNTTFSIQVSAVIFSLIGLFASFAISRHLKTESWTLRLVLAGIMVSALFSAGLGVLKYIADPLSELPEITFWLLGGLWTVTWDKILPVVIPVLISLGIIFAYRWRLNILGLDEKIIFTSGINGGREKGIILLLAVLTIAPLIAVTGIINWVGLNMPHVSRKLFGGNTKLNLPGAMLLGAIFTVWCDTLGRILTPGEIPLGILTSLFGAFAFIIIMSTKNSIKG